MERHIKTLGILHIVYGGLILLGGYQILWAWGPMGLFFGQLHHPFRYVTVGSFNVLSDFLSPLWHFYTFYAGLLLGVFAVIGGWGLYCKKNWGRILVLIIGIVCLLKFPIGTALGIYTLWVLLKPESAQLTTS